MKPFIYKDDGKWIASCPRCGIIDSVNTLSQASDIGAGHDCKWLLGPPVKRIEFGGGTSVSIDSYDPRSNWYGPPRPEVWV